MFSLSLSSSHTTPWQFSRLCLPAPGTASAAALCLSNQLTFVFSPILPVLWIDHNKPTEVPDQTQLKVLDQLVSCSFFYLEWDVSIR